MFFSWIQKAVPSRARQWISKRVLLINKSMSTRKKRVEHFLNIYLEADGLFMIRMIANNTSDYVATDVIHHLWCQHAEKYDRLFPDESHCTDLSIACVFEHKTKPANQIEVSHNRGENFSRDAMDNINTNVVQYKTKSSFMSEENRFPTASRYNAEQASSTYANVNTGATKKRYDEYSRINSTDNLARNDTQAFPMSELVEDGTSSKAAQAKRRESMPKQAKKSDFSEV